MRIKDYDQLYETLVQSLIDTPYQSMPPDPMVRRHTIGLVKALDRWLLKLRPVNPVQARTARPSATLASVGEKP
jgi:hypothetical protein